MNPYTSASKNTLYFSLFSLLFLVFWFFTILIFVRVLHAVFICHQQAACHKHYAAEHIQVDTFAACGWQ